MNKNLPHTSKQKEKQMTNETIDEVLAARTLEDLSEHALNTLHLSTILYHADQRTMKAYQATYKDFVRWDGKKEAWFFYERDAWEWLVKQCSAEALDQEIKQVSETIAHCRLTLESSEKKLKYLTGAYNE